MKNQKKIVSKIGGVVLGLSMMGSFGQSAHAEGSQDLINSGGNRAFLEYRTDFNAGIRRRTTIKVYANVGETINLGSSAKDIGSGVITYRNPSNVAATCAAGAAGVISNVTQEQAGPLPNAGGYTPCIVTVPAGQAGIWEIDFVSPVPTNIIDNPTVLLATASWTESNTKGFVTAWDVTVRSDVGVNQVGRVYANYMSLNMGGDSLSFSSRISVLTFDGYQYLIDANGLDPFGFILFANNKGFKSTATTNPLYRSIQLLGANPGTLPGAITFQDPGTPDNVGTRDYTHKMFFSPTGPDPTMPLSANSPTGSTWLYQTPVAPPIPSNFGFTGIEGTPNQSGTNPLGGNFQFTSPVVGPFSIIIDINNDGIYGNSNDRNILGTAIAGPNTVFWDGKDGDGVNISPSPIGYQSVVKLFAGEIHFPIIDPENNPNGLIISRLRDFLGNPSASPDPYQVFYDDRLTYNGVTDDFSLCATGETPTTPSGCYGTAPNPRAAVNGINGGLATGIHSWKSDFGNIRGMDTWAYYPSVAQLLPGRLLVKSADLSVTKTDGRTTISAGASTTYTIVVGNAGVSDSGIVSFSDTIPATVTNVTWSCTASSGSSCGATTSGTGNTINVTDVSILNGGTLTYTVNGIVAPATTVGTVITNSAKILRSNDVTDPNDPTTIGAGNNTATDTTTVTAAPVLSGYKSVQLTTDTGTSGVSSGDTLTWRVTYANTGTVDVHNFQITDVLDSDVTLVGALAAGNITVNATQAVSPAPNTSYTGAGNNNLFASSFTFKAGGVVTVDIPVTIGSAVTNGQILKNQSTATSNDLPAVGVKTDNIDNTTTGLPTGVTPLTSSIAQTQTAAIDPTTVTAVSSIVSNPKLLLVKRITAINNVNITGFVDDTTSPKAADDNDSNWPSPNTQYLRGAFENITVVPGDRLEYTIYFLVSGNKDLTNITICDLIPPNTTFASGAYDVVGGGSNLGIAFANDASSLPTAPTNYFTSIFDSDRGKFYPAGSLPPTTCRKPNAANPSVPADDLTAADNIDGLVVVNVVSTPTTLPHAIGAGTPTNSYGFVRFQVTVK